MFLHSKTSEANNDNREARDIREKNRKADRGSGKTNNHVRDRSPLSRGRKHASDKQVYVSNIPYEYRWQDLKDLFRDEGRFYIIQYANILSEN